jgi:plasmid stabilization system protein ParE
MAELADAARFYEEASPGLGGAFISEVEKSIELLLRNMHIGHAVAGNVAAIPREFALTRFPYHLVYSVEESGVLIIAVAHQRRRPGYWAHRVEEPQSNYATDQLAA